MDLSWLLTMVKSPWFYLVLIALGTVGYSIVHYTKLDKIPLFHKTALFWVGVVGLILCVAGYFGTFGTASIVSIPVNSGTLVNLAVSNGIVNESGTVTVTDDDYYSSDNHVVTLYLQDVDTEDNAGINVTIIGTRANTEKAGSVLLTCNFNTRFEKDSVTENLVNEDADGDLEAVYTDLKGASDVQLYDQKMTGWMSFAEGDVTDSVVLRYRLEEVTQDKMAEKAMLDIVCNAGGKSVKVVMVADN